MHIPTLKSRLSITASAKELGIEPNRSGKACCPFHDDSSPSFQISEEKQIATCFSPRCEAGTMDVIGLVQKIKGWTLPETLTWLSERAGMVDVVAPAEQIDYGDVFVQMQSSFLNSSVARKYAESRGLSWQQLGLGYNSWKQSRFPFLRGCVVFPLKNEAGEVVSLYGRSVRTTGRTTGKHFYSANRQGLYPGYPVADTRWVILTESVIDAASVPAGDYAVLALYGTNGLSAEHQKALNALSTLQEVTLFFDGDEAGREAVKMQGEKLKTWLPEVRITWMETPEGEAINSLVAEVRSQRREVRLERKTDEKSLSIADLLKHRQDLFLSIETKNESSALAEPKQSPHLDSSDPLKLIYRSATASYLVRGGLRSGAESLRVTLEIESPRGRKLRDRVELYQYKQVEQLAQARLRQLALLMQQIALGDQPDRGVGAGGLDGFGGMRQQFNRVFQHLAPSSDNLGNDGAGHRVVRDLKRGLDHRQNKALNPESIDPKIALLGLQKPVHKACLVSKRRQERGKAVLFGRKEAFVVPQRVIRIECYCS